MKKALFSLLILAACLLALPSFAEGGVPTEAPRIVPVASFMQEASLTLSQLLERYGEEGSLINWAVAFGATYDFDNEAWIDEAEDGIVTTPMPLAGLVSFCTEGAGRARLPEDADPEALAAQFVCMIAPSVP